MRWRAVASHSSKAGASSIARPSARATGQRLIGCLARQGGFGLRQIDVQAVSDGQAVAVSAQGIVQSPFTQARQFAAQIAAGHGLGQLGPKQCAQGLAPGAALQREVEKQGL